MAFHAAYCCLYRQPAGGHLAHMNASRASPRRLADLMIMWLVTWVRSKSCQLSLRTGAVVLLHAWAGANGVPSYRPRTVDVGGLS